MAMALGAFVPGDPVVPFPVAHQPDFAFRASRFPFCSFSKGRPSRAFNLSLLRLSDSAESGAMAAEISPSVICETAFLSNIKTLPTVGRRPEGGVIAKQPGPSRLPTVSDCLVGQLYHRAGYPSFAGVFRFVCHNIHDCLLELIDYLL